MLVAAAAAFLAGTLLTLAGAGAFSMSWGWCLALVCLVAGVTCVATSAPTRPAYTGSLADLAAGRPRTLLALRAVTLLSAPLFGLGVVLYAGVSLMQALRAPTGARDLDWRRCCGTGLIGLGVVLGLEAAGLLVGSESIVWSVLLMGSGLSLFWWLPERKLDSARTDGKQNRVLLYLVTLGLAGVTPLFLLDETGLFDQPGWVIAGTAAALAILVAAPRWLRSSRALRVERMERALATERAELGGLLHDSVLQTLALIQDRADDPAEVVALARRQERELRAWLTGQQLLSMEAPLTIGNALRLVAAEIEDAYRVKIDVVTVGDGALAEYLEPLVAAAREALVNAAKHAPGASISLFGEIDDRRVSVFVRDRGPGIDVAAIPSDRHGVRESIVARMERHGGKAVVRTAPGGGCEVRLMQERPR